MNKNRSLSIIAAVSAMVSVTPRYGWAWGANHVEYQYGEHLKLQAKVSIKKGYHLSGAQERRKALHKRFERKTKHAKGK